MKTLFLDCVFSAEFIFGLMVLAGLVLLGLLERSKSLTARQARALQILQSYLP